MRLRHRLHRLRPSNVATTTITTTTITITTTTITITTTTIPITTTTTITITTTTITIATVTISSPGTGGGVTAAAAIADCQVDDSSRLIVL